MGNRGGVLSPLLANLYLRKAKRNINAYVLRRLAQHLKRRSQRGAKLPTDESDYHSFARLGLVTL